MIERGVTETAVEDAALEWFRGLGYDVLHGPTIASDVSALLAEPAPGENP